MLAYADVTVFDWPMSKGRIRHASIDNIVSSVTPSQGNAKDCRPDTTCRSIEKKKKILASPHEPWFSINGDDEFLRQP